jgi:hypothetical protein
MEMSYPLGGDKSTELTSIDRTDDQVAPTRDVAGQPYPLALANGEVALTEIGVVRNRMALQDSIEDLL